MKHQYFGDINDYRKYGLLRLLADGGKRPVTVCWMLTAGDGRSDGRKIEYLAKPDLYRRHDPELFDHLHQAVLRERRRDVAVVEERALIPGARYFDRMVSAERAGREEYFEGLERFARGSALVFFDQDNGMEVRSVPYGRRNSEKYLYWHELERTFVHGHAVLVYQHFPRVERSAYIRRFRLDVRRRLGEAVVTPLVTGGTLFALLTRPPETKRYASFLRAVAERWPGQISVG